MATLHTKRDNMGATQMALEKLIDSEPVGVPLPRTIRERQERKAGYKTSKKHMRKWRDIVQVVGSRLAVSWLFFKWGSSYIILG